VLRSGKQLLDAGLLDQSSLIENSNLVGDPPDQTNIVRDEQVCERQRS